jgi:hypothetical protein
VFLLPQTSLGVLSEMITPAVLITACGTLIMSTSTRLGRVVDRVRHLSNRFEELADPGLDIQLRDDRQQFVFDQLELNMRRAQLLQRALSLLYSAVCSLIGSSGAIGFYAAFGISGVWMPVALGLIGAFLLFYAGVLLMFEGHLAFAHLRDEFEFRLRMGNRLAPENFHEGRPAARGRRSWLLRRRSL